MNWNLTAIDRCCKARLNIKGLLAILRIRNQRSRSSFTFMKMIEELDKSMSEISLDNEDGDQNTITHPSEDPNTLAGSIEF